MAKKKLKQPEKKSNLTLIYVLLALLAIAVLILYFSAQPEKSQEKLPSAGIFNKLPGKQSTYEPGKVKMMIFLSFSCIHCNNLEKNLPALLEKYGDNVSVTYIPIVWPKQSTKSIEAYIIAEQMGKGDEMLQAMFSARFDKGMDIMESVLAIEDVAASIGLGADFNAKLESGEAKNAALENLKLMREYDVDNPDPKIGGTPQVVINGNLRALHEPISNLDTVIGSLLS